jgi:hypothetical protein
MKRLWVPVLLGWASGCSVESAGVYAARGVSDAADAAPSPSSPGGESPAADAGAPIADAGAPIADAGAPIADAAPAVICPREQSDLVVCLPFEGSVSNVVAQPLTVTSKNVAFQPGPMGQAASLDETSAIKVSESPVLDGQSLTVEAWLSPRALPGPGKRAGIVDNDLEYSMFLTEGGGIRCSVGLIAVDAPGVVTIGRWTSVACTYDASNIEVFVDGASVASGRSGAINIFGLGGVTVGQNNPGGDNYDGLIDNVRVWRIRRTATEICAAARSCR